MAGQGIRLYTDEMIHENLAATLRAVGYDTESCEEAGLGNRRVPDDEQLAYAARVGRAVLTFNVGDFLALDATWKSNGREHSGIIISQALRDFGELLRRVRHHLDTYPPSVQHDTVLWLGAVPDS